MSNIDLKDIISRVEQPTFDDEMIKKALYNNLQEDGFKVLDNTLVRLVKENKSCKKVKDNYAKTHSDNYVSFKLNGKSTINLNDETKYDDEYVTLLINNKQSDNVKINSNLNNNRIGTYLITYKAKISDDYNEYLYRKVIVKKDTIKKVNEDKTITDTIDRTYLYRAATPQGFKFDNYMKAIEKYINDKNAGLVTDDAEIYSKYFGEVKISECSSDNIKITNREDLDIFIKLR